MQGFTVLVQVAGAGEGDLGVGQQVGQRGAQYMGNVGGERRQTLEGVVQAFEHGVDGLRQLLQFERHLPLGQPGGQRARRYLGGHFAHLPQRTQATARRPGAEQCRGQGRETDRQPDQLLHALKKVLVVSDVQKQRELGGRWIAAVEVNAQA
ncbi:hypothetical protein D3C80_1746760 [compost metagenome]